VPLPILFLHQELDLPGAREIIDRLWTLPIEEIKVELDVHHHLGYILKPINCAELS
jgi:hypothetical protein